MIIKDNNSGMPLLQCELPADFQTQAVMQIKQYPLNQVIHVRMQARNGHCILNYQTGDNYLYEKVKQNPYGYPQANQNPYSDDGSWYSVPVSLTEELDRTASMILNREAKALNYYDPSEKLYSKLKNGFDEMTRDFISQIQNASVMTYIPVGTIIRNYLCDAGIGIYENGNAYLAVFLCRKGIEYDTVNGMVSGVHENITGEPFGQAYPTMNSMQSVCNWNVPSIICMSSDRKGDLDTFMTFLETAEIAPELNSYSMQLQQQVQIQKQNFFNNAFAQQMQGWAASDALGRSLSQDLDRFHHNLNQQMAQNDMRFSPSYGETSDDRIQRMRHESMMGVETYERQDGSTYEYSNMADRVFENNLDETTHFGTRNYYDDYVPEGWHEMKKK